MGEDVSPDAEFDFDMCFMLICSVSWQNMSSLHRIRSAAATASLYLNQRSLPWQTMSVDACKPAAHLPHDKRGTSCSNLIHRGPCFSLHITYVVASPPMPKVQTGKICSPKGLSARQSQGHLLKGPDIVACRWDRLSLAYTEPRGLPELREEVAKLYNGVSADEVLILAPQEAITIAMLAILRPGDHVVVAFPGYQSLYAIARAIGAEISFWHMRADEEGGLGFQVSCCILSYITRQEKDQGFLCGMLNLAGVMHLALQRTSAGRGEGLRHGLTALRQLFTY